MPCRHVPLSTLLCQLLATLLDMTLQLLLLLLLVAACVTLCAILTANFSQVLRWETSRTDHPTHAYSALGASVFGYDDVHVRLHAFLHQWRTYSSSHTSAGAVQPYIVCADVAGAFESVDTGVVMELVEALLAAPSYLLIKYSEVRRLLVHHRHAVDCRHWHTISVHVLV